MVNPAIEGKRYPRTSPYLVGREKLTEFANATMATDSNGESAPPTFPIVIQERSLKQVLMDPESQLDFSRVVHGDQRFVFERAIVAGDELTSELSVTSVKSLGGNHLVTFNTEIFDATNKLVCTAISTLVVRGEDA
ncbi:MAG: MaoC family dehydratase N-terminal domain-containing protein [Aquiluna sp.]